MKRAVFAIAVGILALILHLLAVTGYEVALSTEASLYQEHANVPFAERTVSGHIERGEKLSVYGCFDNKSDYYFYVMRENGVSGYLYELKYKAAKNWVPRMERIAYFFREPLASIQCLIMVPELSR